MKMKGTRGGTVLLAAVVILVLVAAAQVTRDEFDALKDEIQALRAKVVMLDIRVKDLEAAPTAEAEQPQGSQPPPPKPRAQALPQQEQETAVYAWVTPEGKRAGHLTFKPGGTFRCDSGQLVKDADFWCNSPKDKTDRDYQWTVGAGGLRITFMVGTWLFRPAGNRLDGCYVGKSAAGHGQEASLVPTEATTHSRFIGYVNARQARAKAVAQCVAPHRRSASPSKPDKARPAEPSVVFGRWQGVDDYTSSLFDAPSFWALRYQWKPTAKHGFCLVSIRDADGHPIGVTGDVQTGHTYLHSGGRVYLQVIAYQCRWTAEALR